ncbi:MAG: hypothetical protein JWM11_2485, partial [Planctomycetaceae bacterium]|nr:hypothetical protein [Planctomycetaceae bacterium]
DNLENPADLDLEHRDVQRQPG